MSLSRNQNRKRTVACKDRGPPVCSIGDSPLPGLPVPSIRFNIEVDWPNTALLRISHRVREIRLVQGVEGFESHLNDLAVPHHGMSRRTARSTCPMAKPGIGVAAQRALRCRWRAPEMPPGSSACRPARQSSSSPDGLIEQSVADGTRWPARCPGTAHSPATEIGKPLRARTSRIDRPSAEPPRRCRRGAPGIRRSARRSASGAGRNRWTRDRARTDAAPAHTQEGIARIVVQRVRPGVGYQRLKALQHPAPILHLQGRGIRTRRCWW